MLQSIIRPGIAVPVRRDDDIPCLVKEGEVLTGMPGRAFVIRSADHLVYRVIAQPGGLEVRRLDEGFRVRHSAYLSFVAFEHHPIAQAQRAGCLFTEPLRR